jgi:glycosyltransferase involved in cell wall biosynthesis
VTVGVVTTSFPRWPGDFAGCFVEDAVRAELAGGATVEVIAAGADVPLRADLGPQARLFRVAVPAGSGPALFYDGGAPEALEGGPATPWAQAFFFWAGLCQTIRARAAAGAWRRIVAHWLVPSALAARAAAPHLSLSAYAHSGDVALLERCVGGRSLARMLARNVDDVIFVSEDLRRRFGALAGRLVGRVGPVGPTPVVAPRSSAMRAAARESLWPGPSFPLDAPVILSVGRLVPIKGFDVLLRATARARPSAAQPSPVVVILGDGAERDRLQHLARTLNVNLHLPGFVPRDTVRAWMAAADVYVQPSVRLASGRTEGRPTATLEALSMGVPVVTSDSGGLAELPGVWTVPAGDVPSLSSRLASVCPA